MNEFIIPISDEFDEFYFLKGFNNGRYPYSHSLLIGNYLIDTGISNKYIRKLKKSFQIENVILSHWHEDHVLGNRLFKEQTFYSHPLDKPIIENVNLMYDYYGVTNTPAEELFRAFMEGYKIGDTLVQEQLQDHQIIDINQTFNLEVIHTPGHTAGHCSFYEYQTKALFLADIDLSNFAFYGCLDSNLLQLEQSVIKLEKLGAERAISGHKGLLKGKENIRERLNRYLTLIHDRDEQVMKYLSETRPITIESLVNKNLIYKKYNPAEIEYELIAEKIMLGKHFEKFLQKGMIEKKEKGFVLA